MGQEILIRIVNQFTTGLRHDLRNDSLTETARTP